MDKVCERVTVYFESPFWVAVFERRFGGSLSASKVTFGAEPKDYEINEFIGRFYYSLQFSPAVKADEKTGKANPKRALRDAKKQVVEKGIATKAQQALKLQQEQNKLAKKEISKVQREEALQRQYDLRQQKKKEKHRGH